MENKLSWLLLLACLVAHTAYAQKPRSGLTAEQERQWRETVEINKMLLLRQNPQAHFSKEKAAEFITAKAKLEDSPINKLEQAATLRKKMRAYYAAHPAEAKQFNNGNVPPATGVLALMEELNVVKLDAIQFDALTEKQKMALFATEPTLKEKVDFLQQKLAESDAKSKERIYKHLWEEFKQQQQ